MWEVVGLLVSRSCVGQSVGWLVDTCKCSILLFSKSSVGWLVGRYVQVSTSIYVVLDGRLVDTRASVAPRQTPTLPTPQLE